jgi:pescadillo protein
MRASLVISFVTIKNKLCCLPTGETLPPHLSPFVGERRVGDYIPPEERQLTADTPDVAALEQEEQEEEEEEESEMSEEEEEPEEKEEVKEGRREKTDKEAEKKMQETEEYR